MHTYICTCSVQYMAFVQLQGINKIKQLQIQIIIKLKQLNAIYFKISIIKTLFLHFMTQIYIVGVSSFFHKSNVNR